jgi:hypothetical protein
MLTSSDKMGQAMKVTDHNRVNGAILVYAITPLKESRGLVMVLVSLQ